MIPWKLDTGVYLEDRSLLLPWGAPFEGLVTLGTPHVNRQQNSTHLTWRDCTVIGGVRGDVEVCRIDEPPNPRAFHIYLPELHWAQIRLGEVHRHAAAAHRQMRRVHEVVVAATGQKATSYSDYAHNLPGIIWRLPGLTMTLRPSCKYDSTRREHPLVSIQLSLSLAHEPAGFSELKEEARLIRLKEGKGREVDFVAWHEPYDEPDDDGSLAQDA